MSVKVVDLVRLSPPPRELAEHVLATGRVVAAHPTDSELARRVLSVALGEAFLYLESPPSDCDADSAAVERAVRTSVFY